MTGFSRVWLLLAAALALFGALLHLVIPFGGPGWYAFFGAPPGLVQMAQAGSLRPVISCLVIAAVLSAVAAYGFSGAGLIRRLPLLRPVLALVGFGLLVRGLGFLPLAMWWPRVLSGLCGRCDGPSPFLLITSALCVCVGIGYLLGARKPHSN